MRLIHNENPPDYSYVSTETTVSTPETDHFCSGLSSQTELFTLTCNTLLYTGFLALPSGKRLNVQRSTCVLLHGVLGWDRVQRLATFIR